MDKSPEVIRQEMDQTRSAMQQKLETLEEQVKNTVQDATATVNAVAESVTNVTEKVEQSVAALTGTVESVEQTVSAVTGSVEQTVAAVTGTVDSAVTSVKQTLDLPQQVRQHPWAMVAGAVAVGYVATKLLEGPRRSAPATAAATASVTDHRSARQRNSHGNDIAAAPKPQSTWWGAIAGHYGKELDKLKSLAIAAVGNVVREAAVSSAAPALADRIKQVVDGVTEKLGGEPIEGSILNPGDHTATPEKDLAKAGARTVSMGNR